MSTEYHLYRAKFIRPQQTSFLHEHRTPASLFLDSVSVKPYAEFRKDYTWHIGNLSNFEPSAGYFAVGRSSPTSIPRLDSATGDFVDTHDDTSPYTFVVYDAAIGLMVIQKNSELAASTEAIASKLERLLGNTPVLVSNEIDVAIDPIPDPDGFIAKLHSAYAIKLFKASFTGPNPFDADEFFQKPLSVYLQAANGECGSATIEGTHLDGEVVSAVARSTAATGNRASAKIQEEKGQRAVRINLSGDPVKLVYEEEVIPKKTVLKDARAAYRKVRYE